MTSKITRRTFNRTAAAAGALATLNATGMSALGSNERIQLGMIGVGNRGDQLIDAFLPHKDAQIVALCDVYEPYLEAAQKKIGGNAKLYHDYRQLLDRINAPKRVMLTPAMLGEDFVIRICIVSHRTHRDRVEMALEDIRAAVAGYG